MNLSQDSAPLNTNPEGLALSRRRIAILVLLLGLVGIAAFLFLRPFRSKETLLNVSYDASREFYSEINEAFARRASESAGAEPVRISHAGSSKQSQALIRGMMADVVTLASAC